MRLLLELSMEHPTLPAAEARATLEASGTPGEVVAEADGVLVVDAPGADPGELADRVGLTHRVLAPWTDAAPTAEALVEALEAVDLADRAPPEATVAVRSRRMGGAHPDLDVPALVRDVGEVLARRWAVDLEAPDVEVRVLLTGDRAYVGRVRAVVDRSSFERRHVEERPFFSPVSLHPRQARALVNLARVRPGHRVLDPFVGTGGIALEAGLVGAQVVASDLDARMVEGTRDVLAHYGVEPAVLRSADVGDVPDGTSPVDAVVTDPPYGRAATTAQEELEALYDRFLDTVEAVLRPGGWCVAAFPDEAHVDRVGRRLDLVEHHVQRVHGSLTRHVAVARAPGEGS